ncbi:MAG: ComF family protein, partial [Clostridiales bacterium]
MGAQQLRSWLSAAALLLYPQPRCILCGGVATESGLCSSCQNVAKYRTCGHCACFLPDGAANCFCTACTAAAPSFALARAALPYQGELRQALLMFKYQEQIWLKRPLTSLLQAAFEQYYRQVNFQLVMAVPLARERYRQRGYNQSAILAKELAYHLALPYQSDVLRRIKHTPPLAELNKDQRFQVLKGAFAADSRIAGKTILLIDDIYTTGATASSC